MINTITLTPGFGDKRNSATIYVGDCIESLKSMPEKSIQTCATSPPYWGLRDYGHDEQIGLETTLVGYIAKMVEVFREVRRVLRDDGTLWLNLGDSYCGGGLGAAPKGIKPKDLVGIPWRVALALQADGWYLRQDIIWHKPNHMPESVTDRCTKSHEYIFLLSKNSRYYFDSKAIMEPTKFPGLYKALSNPKTSKSTSKNTAKGEFGRTAAGFTQHDTLVGDDKNRRSVWTIAPKAYAGAHFATFPEKLVEPMVLAGSSEVGCCPTCGTPWGRGENIVKWEPTCKCPEHKPVPCLVLDPFTGSGTTGAVSLRLGRNFVGCELNPEYAKLAESRILGDSPPDSDESGESGDSDSVFDLFGNDEG